MLADHISYASYLGAIRKMGYEMHDFGRVDGSYLKYIEIFNDPSLPWITLNGPAHPPEVSAVYGFLAFLARDLPQGYNYLMVPTMNPYGFDQFTRTNGQGIDLNHSFNVSPVPLEITCYKGFVQEKMMGRKMARVLELHADLPEDLEEGYEEEAPPDGLYIYQEGGDIRHGRVIMDTLGRRYRITTSELVYGYSCSGGVIHCNPFSGDGHDRFLETYLGQQGWVVFTSEPPGTWVLEKGIKAQLDFLDACLRLQ